MRIKTKVSKILRSGKGKHSSAGKNKALRVRTLARSNVVDIGYSGRIMSRLVRMEDARAGKTLGITPVKASMCSCTGTLEDDWSLLICSSILESFLNKGNVIALFWIPNGPEHMIRSCFSKRGDNFSKAFPTPPNVSLPHHDAQIYVFMRSQSKHQLLPGTNPQPWPLWC